jgi:FkbM family methyltransferase
VPLIRRAIGALSRRLDRPELLAAAYPASRQELHERIAIRAVLASCLRSDSSYVDVGANRGQVLREAIHAAPDGRHVAFEPIPALAEELGRRFPSVDCRPLALGNAARTATFCHFRRLDGWSGLRRNTEISDERGDPEYITVRVSTLDAELAGGTPAVVKIDVEGAELEVLEGAAQTLSRARPLLIFEHVKRASELYGSAPDAVWGLLDELGYEILSVTGDGPFARERFAADTSVVNWLARPR